jgi:alkylated DNA repair dioxygenase AlkB
VPRSRRAAAPPDGLVYRPGLLSPAEHDELLATVEALPFEEIVMKGVVARRTAARFGYGYDYDRRVPVEGGAPFPPWLAALRNRVAPLAGLAGDDLVQGLVQRYPPGAPIGWHRDSPAYDVVVGVSLASPAPMRFRRGPAGDREQWEVLLEPGSAYVLAGEVRWRWEHHVPPAKSLRYSVTLRSVRERRSPR